jgi:FMN hydrolase / 5-amino-6-(5-phospho-D-ribitylamino)uracil phosphatase
MPRLRLVCFDLDNTLWHVEPVLLRAERETWDWLVGRVPELSIVFDAAQVRARRDALLRTRPEYVHDLTSLRRDAMRDTLLAIGLARTAATEIARDAMDVFLALRNQVVFFPGALDVLERLRTRHALAALSNGNASLERIGAGRLFDVVLSAETVGRAKPDPAMFHRALDEAGVTAREAVHVGDHPEHDVLAARRAGLHAVWANPLALARPASLPADVPSFAEFADLERVLDDLERRNAQDDAPPSDDASKLA